MGLIQQLHDYVHSRLGFCFWDIPAVIVLLVMLAVLAVHIVKQRRREQELKKQLESAREHAKQDAPGAPEASGR